MSGKNDEVNRDGQIGQIPAPGGHVAYIRHRRQWRPSTDIIESEGTLYVVIEIAGMENGQIEVTLQERQLTIKGVRPPRDLGNTEGHYAFHQLEINYGEFQTDITLPWPIDEDGIKAQYDDGFLVITCPRASQFRVTILPVE